MVRNAFACADDIHARASLAESSSTAVPEASTGQNAQDNDADIGAPQPGQLLSSAADMETNFNSSTSLGLNPCESGDTERHETPGDAAGNEEMEETSSDSSAETNGSSSDDMSTDDEDLEELLGQIPNDRMGSNPEIDIVATLPLYEGNTLSMLCASYL